MTFRFVAVLSVIALSGGMVGCKQEDSSPAPQAGPSDVAPGTPAAPGNVAKPNEPVKALAVPEGADTDAVLAELTREVRRWILRNRRAPKSFEEVLSTTPLQVPPPPPGKKYVLTREMRVILEKR